MNADDDKINEAIWPYLHGELDADRRAEFEKELGARAELRARLARAGRVDQLVRASLGRAAALAGRDADEALTDELLSVWERDQAAAERARPLSAPRVGWFAAPAWRTAAWAAAALLVLAVTPALLVSPKARWSEPEFVPLAYRGAAAPAAASRADPATAARCQEALSSELSRLLEARGAKLPAGLALSLRVHELRDGAFSVCVRARFRDGRPAGEWTGDFTSVDAYVSHAVSSARAIAEELGILSGAEGVGGRP